MKNRQQRRDEVRKAGIPMAAMVRGTQDSKGPHFSEVFTEINKKSRAGVSYTHYVRSLVPYKKA